MAPSLSLEAVYLSILLTGLDLHPGPFCPQMIDSKKLRKADWIGLGPALPRPHGNPHFNRVQSFSPERPGTGHLAGADLSLKKLLRLSESLSPVLGRLSGQACEACGNGYTINVTFYTH